MSRRQTFLLWWAELEPELIKASRRYGTSPNDAEDAVQDVALLALENYSRFNEKSEFRKWALARLHWRTLDNLRRISRQVTIDPEALATSVEETHSHDVDVDKLTQLIRQLPERQQRVILMTIEGYSAKAIAQKMDITEATVRSLRRFAKSHLARLAASKE